MCISNIYIIIHIITIVYINGKPNGLGYPYQYPYQVGPLKTKAPHRDQSQLSLGGALGVSDHPVENVGNHW